MKLRIGGKLYKRMMTAKNVYGVGLSEMTERAIRAWLNSGEMCSNNPTDETATSRNDGTVITIKYNYEPALVRNIIDWYLAQYEANGFPGTIKPFHADAVEGIDYIVSE